ncbi:CLUMA_CG001772, isoform A [Clunio marinus]|uniref:CLUMA_CG001772, isoform A n=1 Tax=Clunio marinus TaxID=568069 RepID=A0A1J1HKC0_9DIPT|nr:CLUMA_CG001772, isoform A [Clunio marinus]
MNKRFSLSKRFSLFSFLLFTFSGYIYNAFICAVKKTTRWLSVMMPLRLEAKVKAEAKALRIILGSKIGSFHMISEKFPSPGLSSFTQYK